jgi:hypothetical protein
MKMPKRTKPRSNDSPKISKNRQVLAGAMPYLREIASLNYVQKIGTGEQSHKFGGGGYGVETRFYDPSSSSYRIRIKCTEGMQQFWVKLDFNRVPDFQQYIEELNARFS